jgi:hypothetical protein
MIRRGGPHRKEDRMYGVDPGGWLAAHRVEHRELIQKAASAARRPVPEGAARKPAAAAVPVVGSTAPVCC